MEDHKKNLQQTCRKCASIIVLNHGYINAKNVLDYNYLLYTKFNVDIGNDNEDIHLVHIGENWTWQSKEMY